MIIAGIILYYILSRALIVFYYALTEPNWKLEFSFAELMSALNSEDFSYSGFIFAPITGEIHLISVLGSILIWCPIFMIWNTGLWIRNKREDKLQLKLRRKAYLDNLAKYGLTPGDIPDYIQDARALDEYLSVWKKHQIL